MTTATATTDLKIVQFRARGFMRLEAAGIDVDLNGNHLVLSGPNGSGKSSCLDALWSALGGKPTKDLPEPIHQGESKASVCLVLKDRAGQTMNVERVWTEKSTRVVITAPDGSRLQKPQELLDSLIDSYSLDPGKFLRLRPQDQVDEVLRTLGVVPPVDQVEEITGEKFPARPDESASAYLERGAADETGLFYCRRRDAHRELARKEAAIAEQHALVDRLGGPVKSGEKQTSAAAILEEIERLQAQADARRQAQQESLDMQRKAVEKVKLLETLEAESQALQDQIDQLQAKKAEVDQRIEKGSPIVLAMKKQVGLAQERVNTMPDPTAKIAELRNQVQNIEQANATQIKRQQATEQLTRLAHEKEHAEADHAKLDVILTRLRELRQNLLNDMSLGVSGLQIEAGELRLNGVPFKQASQAEKINVACALACRRNPALKILRLDDAEHLDEAHRRLLLSLADRYGFQCFLTFVRDTQGLQVEIVDAEKF